MSHLSLTAAFGTVNSADAIKSGVSSTNCWASLRGNNSNLPSAVTSASIHTVPPLGMTMGGADLALDQGRSHNPDQGAYRTAPDTSAPFGARHKNAASVSSAPDELIESAKRPCQLSRGSATAVHDRILHSAPLAPYRSHCR